MGVALKRLLLLIIIWHNCFQHFSLFRIYLGVPVVAQQKRIQLVPMRMQVQSLASLSGLRIWHCRELQYRLQMQLGSHVAVAVV